MIANPPFSLKEWGRDLWEADPWSRAQYGLPPESCEDYAFVQHMLASMAPTGDSRMAVVLPQGSLFRKAAEGKIRRALLQADLVEELVQEAWLSALPRLQDLVPREGRLTPVLLRFLSTTVLNRIRNLLRARARHGSGRPADAETKSPNPMDLVPAEQTGAVSRAIRRELGDQVHDVLQELDAQDREVVLLRAVEQLPNETVGVLVSLSAEAVSKRYHRALSRIRARLPGSAFDEVDP